MKFGNRKEGIDKYVQEELERLRKESEGLLNCSEGLLVSRVLQGIPENSGLTIEDILEEIKIVARMREMLATDFYKGPSEEHLKSLFNDTFERLGQSTTDQSDDSDDFLEGLPKHSLVSEGGAVDKELPDEKEIAASDDVEEILTSYKIERLD